MMSFCKKSVHSFLGLTPMDSSSAPPKCHSSSLSGGGLGLVTATSAGDIHRSNNVVESSTIKSSTTTHPITPPLFDGVIGGGLMSCTESLGFESSDDMRRADDDDQIELSCSKRSSSSTENSNNNNKWRKMTEEKREVKVFPPPLSSLDQNGNPCFFLRPVRKNGRLELSEVRIDRPEILRAHREDGRLKLHLIRNDFENEIIEEEDELESESEIEDEIQSPAEPPDEQSRRRTAFTGEGFGRCHEMLNRNRYNNHHSLNQVWSQQQQYVASR